MRSIYGKYGSSERMRLANIDQLRTKEAALKGKLAEGGKGLEAAARRGLAKKLRRAQRRRRAAAVETARRAAGKPAPASDAPAATEAPAEQAETAGS